MTRSRGTAQKRGMLDGVRHLLHRALTTSTGNGLVAVRVTKDIARGLNNLAGEPLCSAEELERRRAAEARLVELRKNPVKVPTRREPAPVVVYFEKDRNQRNLKRVGEVLEAKGITYKSLDVTGDQATLSWVMRQSGRERDELPVVFVGDACIGGLSELVASDTRGELVRAVFGLGLT